MEKLRKSLKDVLESNSLTATLLPAARGFLLIYPALFLLAKFTYINFYYSLSAVLYVLFILGVVFSFALGADLEMTIAFGLLAVSYLKTFLNYGYFDFNIFVYFAFYCILAVWSYGNMKSQGRAEESGEALRYCPACGKQVRTQANFCPFCGAECRSSERKTEKLKTAAVDYTGPGREVVELCGGVTVLVFNLIFSAYLCCDTFQNFSFMTLLVQIPNIMICVGGWMLYASCSKGQPKTSGFTVINTVLLIRQIFATIPWIVVLIAGLLLLLAGESTTAIGFLVLLGDAIALSLVTMYWNGMRRATVQGRKLLRGEDTVWSSSLLVIVLTGFNVAGQLWSLFAQSGTSYMEARLADSIWQWTYEIIGNSIIADYVYQYLASILGLNRGSGLQTLASILSVSVPVCAIVILAKIRGYSQKSQA